MGTLFMYSGPVTISVGSKFISDGYLTMKRLSPDQTGIQHLVITGCVEGIPKRYCTGTVLTLEMYNGAKLDFTVDEDGLISNIGDVRNATGPA